MKLNKSQSWDDKTARFSSESSTDAMNWNVRPNYDAVAGDKSELWLGYKYNSSDMSGQYV